MRAAFLGVFLAFSASVAFAETASPLHATWQRCMRSESGTSTAQAIAACTEIIDSGAETQANTAVAYFNRANATVGSDAHQAEADYTQAIQLGYINENVYYGRGIARDKAGAYQG